MRADITTATMTTRILGIIAQSVQGSVTARWLVDEEAIFTSTAPRARRSGSSKNAMAKAAVIMYMAQSSAKSTANPITGAHGTKARPIMNADTERLKGDLGAGDKSGSLHSEER